MVLEFIVRHSHIEGQSGLIAFMILFNNLFVSLQLKKSLCFDLPQHTAVGVGTNQTHQFLDES